MTMIERVAKAIFQDSTFRNVGFSANWEAAHPSVKNEARSNARAAIEAIGGVFPVEHLRWANPSCLNNYCRIGVGSLHRRDEGYSISHENSAYYLSVDDGRAADEQALGEFRFYYEAERAAQVDYEKRVRSALASEPS